MSLPNCPKCASEYTYEDGSLYVCPMCNHEWNDTVEETESIRDMNGNVLLDGDSVTVIKDLKVKGAPTLKQGTTINNIRLREDHAENVVCKVDGFGVLYLKSEFLKKI